MGTKRQREKTENRGEDRGESLEILHPDRWRDRESEREQRVSEQEMDRRWGKQIKKTGARDGQTDRKGEGANNYRTPSVFKAPLLSHPSCD